MVVHEFKRKFIFTLATSYIIVYTNLRPPVTFAQNSAVAVILILAANIAVAASSREGGLSLASEIRLGTCATFGGGH